jgi:hypothetical protein
MFGGEDAGRLGGVGEANVREEEGASFAVVDVIGAKAFEELGCGRLDGGRKRAREFL